MKSQEPGISLEESNGEKSSEQRGPRKSPTRHPEESTGRVSQPALLVGREAAGEWMGGGKGVGHGWTSGGDTLTIPSLW
ncbi:hypothetical protein DV515_00017669 [Chloebia gouldiae]|uniref:Uncharacterized protein n=1 Tax=Chloebia gouldiae TaxID=44316 RepID=A0A3L8Q9P4_CHLGU|nr:hypothetical protein DV515_00017670 [Chloebia gouldiae]RLV64028.1 hypothetical protein DV515_00017669 [Chloebia gouldiae]